MTNKELQDLLKEFPDDAEVWEGLSLSTLTPYMKLEGVELDSFTVRDDELHRIKLNFEYQKGGYNGK